MASPLFSLSLAHKVAKVSPPKALFMRTLAVLFIGCVLCTTSVYALASGDWQWLLAYRGQSTAAVVSDKNFRYFLDDAVPDFIADFGSAPNGLKVSLRNALYGVLSGPPDTAAFGDDHTVVLSACRYHSCAEKGFMWIDVDHKQSVMAIIHYVYQGEHSYDKAQLFLASNDFKCDAYPAATRERIQLWLSSNEIEPVKTRCLEGGNVIEVGLANH